MMHVEHGTGDAILSRDGDGARARHKVRLPVVALARPREQIPANAERHRQFLRGTPLILPEEAAFGVAEVRHAAGQGCFGGTVGQAQQKVRPRTPGARGPGWIIRIVAGPAKDAGKAAHLEETEIVMGQVAAELHRVLVVCIGDRIAELNGVLRHDLRHRIRVAGSGVAAGEGEAR